ncbi:hypothetical protein RB653_004941 [Dictyostelium firmibasis]|uniref:Chromo domain-containing protein n=1 Tax=Dictyostelium firmibasis TaxID=79012 RepID=A0AAN7U0F8_9MYCE
MDSNNYRYNVEEILDKRIIDGSIEYFIKWEGYSFNESTWEILDDGFNKNMLETFERNRFETIVKDFINTNQFDIDDVETIVVIKMIIATISKINLIKSIIIKKLNSNTNIFNNDPFRILNQLNENNDVQQKKIIRHNYININRLERTIKKRYRNDTFVPTPLNKNQSRKTVRIFKDLYPTHYNQVDVYNELGLPIDLVDEIVRLCRNSVKAFKCLLDSRLKVLLVLFFLKKGPNSTSLLKRIFSISSATISRAVRALIPLMIPCLYTISLELMNLNCLHYVDCTDFRINRVHPYQFEWYRGDLKYHSFTIQILVDENGTIDSAIIGKGHNNDSGMSMLTGLNDLIYSFIKNGEEFSVLADPAYNGTLFYTPKRIKNLLGKGDEILSNQERKVVESRFHHFQAGKRSLVENKFADMKNRWGIVKQRGIHQPNFLSLYLDTCENYFNKSSKLLELIEKELRSSQVIGDTESRLNSSQISDDIASQQQNRTNVRRDRYSTLTNIFQDEKSFRGKVCSRLEKQEQIEREKLDHQIKQDSVNNSLNSRLITQLERSSNQLEVLSEILIQLLKYKTNPNK